MRKPLPIYMLESDHVKLKELAKKEGQTMNALVNKWIKSNLKRAAL